MLGLIKSIGSKAISSLPVFSSSRVRLLVPYDPQLEDKLKEISTQILKAQSNEQFKVYQQLQSVQGADFNRCLRKIYECEQCTTETINAIIRFYTFLLTNCKNELVICKLVSQPLVIQLTKIVLQINQQDIHEKQLEISVTQQTFNNDLQQDLLGIVVSDVENFPGKHNIEIQKKTHQNIQNQTENFCSSEITNISNKKTKHITPLLYNNFIDWDEVNAYKVALIRAYINCINPQTINYMIVENELPIFVNCINGYKHYLTEGVQGTCISNCILMILTKVNHNDEVCDIVFDERHHVKNMNKYQTNMLQIPQKLSKSISTEKSTKLHEFIQQIIVQISQQLQKILTYFQSVFQQQQQSQSHQNLSIQNTTTNMAQNYKSINILLQQHRKLQPHQEFIESNILFCVDVINSISNYNYTSKIKQAIGGVIQLELIGKVVAFIQKNSSIQNNPFVELNQNRFSLTLLKVTKLIFNLSLACQKQTLLIKFLNKHSITILNNIIQMNTIAFFNAQQDNQHHSQNNFKQCLSYICNYFLILLKQTISPFSKLASRKRLQNDHQIIELKENILEKIFIILEQITKSQQLKEGLCYKSVRNLLLTVFYLTIKEDKCTVGEGSSLSSSPACVKKTSISPQKQRNSKDEQNINSLKSSMSFSKSQNSRNIGLSLSFNYSILLLHQIFSNHFKKLFALNTNWEFIVNNYETLMREVPNTILSPQQSDKYCHYHNNNNYQLEDKIRDTIMVYEAVRNYRYMIIHQTNLETRLIRLQNIYHKHFLSPGWGYQPGEVVTFNSNAEYKIVCTGLLHNNNFMKLPIEILQDFQCLLITHKLSQNTFKIIANIRYKKISSFVPQGKSLIRMKLIGIQELILQFGSPKMLQTFKQYLNENRNKTRQKQLKFINYYLNLYLKDTQKMIEKIYDQQIVEDRIDQQIETCGQILNNNKNEQKQNQRYKDQNQNKNEGANKKVISFSKIETDSLFHLDNYKIPEDNNADHLQQNKQDQNMDGKQSVQILQPHSNPTSDLIQLELDNIQFADNQQPQTPIDQLKLQQN